MTPETVYLFAGAGILALLAVEQVTARLRCRRQRAEFAARRGAELRVWFTPDTTEEPADGQ